MSDKQPMTVIGKAQLDAELKELTLVERPKVVKDIEEARSHGDLSENAEYDAAKERQAMVEGRIGEIQGKIANAEVIDPTQIESNRIVFGATVELLDVETEDKLRYQIVGEDEADVKAGKISVFSPLARSMIGKTAGDVIEFKSPKGEKEYEVLNYSFK